LDSERSRDHAVPARAGRPYGILFEDRADSVRILAVMNLHPDFEIPGAALGSDSAGLGYRGNSSPPR
jgi:hypothetical protein